MKTYILHKNNKTSIIFIKNTKNQACIKYINMQHHYI